MMQNIKKGKKIFLYLTFLGPSMLFFLLVFVLPLIYGAYLTFTNWDGLSTKMQFVGWTNYVTVFQDQSYWKSLLLTVEYSSISVVTINILAFGLAYLLTSGVKGQNFLRAGFFTPNLIGGLILGYVWQFIFSRVVVNMYKIIPIALFQRSWLSSPHTAMAALIFVTTWQYSGYMLLIYIAGFAGIPADMIEAARIDGATERKITWSIRLPMMVSSIVISFFLSIIRTFKVYDLNFSLTAGGPYDSTKLAAMHIYTKAFEEQSYGSGQAEALVMFIIMASITLTQTYIGKKRELEI
jgi:raffinose/stachyose/melibiose transport system permease protein